MADLTTPLQPFVDGRTRRARFSVRPATPAELPPVEGLLAGAAVADLTPPPGLPKAGYSANALDGQGFRTRLRARVVHLRSGRRSVAIVQCDLLGGSSVVQHLVAQAIAERTDVPLAGLMMGATHTHAGPGQFLGTDFYNRFASNRSGFDPAYTDFLVRQIAGAVIEAVETRAPARMAVGRTAVWGLTRNRSLVPHVDNETVDDKRTAPQRKYVSINPWLHLLRVDRVTDDGGHEPLAATVIFSVHGTGISMKAPEYNADLWAYLVGELDHRIEEAHGRRAVVGAVEGTHADVAPAIRPGTPGPVEAERVGRGIGAEAAALHDRLGAELTDDVQLAAGFREIDLGRDASIDGVKLPERPAVGAALVAGAHENVTPILHRLPPFRPGSPKRWGHPNPQGEKWVLGTRWLQPLMLPLRSFPRILPAQVLVLGRLAVVGLPFEITVESGRRIEAAVHLALAGAGADVDFVAVSSLANEYSGYVATAEEYRHQFYEGGHTLYGPNTQPFLAAHAARLATEVGAHGVVSDVATERRWDLRVHRYLPEAVPVEVERCWVGDATYTDPTPRTDGYWEAHWADEAPGNLAWHEPMIRVESSTDGAAWVPAQRRGRAVDDQGWAIEVTFVRQDDDVHHYRVRWYDPILAADRRHRFVLMPNAGQPELASPPFD
jgi:neutral ceramidase